MASKGPVLPAAFVGHGSPMNALEHNRFTEAWRVFGDSVPRPRAILVVSAHWMTSRPMVTAMERPRTIHDFGGFPRELSEVHYDAPGAPELAAEVADLLTPLPVAPDLDWGLDHGTWSILVHMFPDADVPVAQLSLGAMDHAAHLALGAALNPLRERGVLIVGSGNVVHNLRRLDWSSPDAGFDWTESFDAAARDIMTTRPGDIGRLVEHGAYPMAVPTDEHLLPLFYVAGLAHVAGVTADVFVGGPVHGSLSMTSFVVPGS